MVIETTNLKKSFGKVEAVRGLDLAVPQGSICGFLGRNGAGKTTTLKMLQGMLHPDSGEGRVFGLRIDDANESVAIRQRVAFVGEDKGTLAYLKVRDVIKITRAFYPRWSEETSQKLLQSFELQLNRLVADLSKGGQTKLALLLALSRGADALVLDEPSEGLDPAAIEELLQSLVVMNAETGATVFFSSHQLAEVEQIADRVVIIDKGRTVVQDSLDDLKNNYHRVRLVFDSTVPVIAGARVNGRVASMLVRGELEEVLERARAMKPCAIDVDPVTLKEIFLDCVKGEHA